jgi:tRNA G10  N-methylase Trm11
MIKFFILGRNPLLSQAEIVSYLESNKIEYTQVFFKRNFLVLEFNKDITLDIQNFGGIIKIGTVSFRGRYNKFMEFVNDNELVEKDKFTYSMMGNISDEFLINKFKKDRRKAVIRRGRKVVKLQKDDWISMPSAEVEFFAYEFMDETYFGVVEQDYSYAEIKERDMKKPVRRESLAISPRLAKILVNLSQVKKGGLLLDPFCGVGGILQEALILGINVYGIDKDRLAIENAKKNLKWIENKYELSANYKLLNADAKKAPNIKFDAVATEPALGEVVRRRPKDYEAREIISSFEKLIISVLQRLKNLKKENAKIVLTCPYIRDFSVNMEKICQQTGLKIYNFKNIVFPIKEFREDQFISREIWVLS